MNDLTNTCHKCHETLGSVVLASDSDGKTWTYDWECGSCGATWETKYHLKPIERKNHE